MPISEEDYKRYLKPILDNEDIWRSDNVLYEVVTGELRSKIKNDHRMDDFTSILMELVSRRKQLLEENPIKGYTVDIDADGNPTGEFKPVETQWLL